MPNKIIPRILFILPFLLSLLSCATNNEKYYYGEELRNSIKKIKKNKHYTYLSYQLPNPHKDDVRAYIDKKIQYTFNAKKFKNGEAIFALPGRSTMNYGILDQVTDGNLIRLDSVSCEHGEFLFLKLNPVKKGHYKIQAWGCRYGKSIDIVLE